ncbi:MAG: family hydrolase [Actinomycetota bacterium]|nr:family hydrolase [Actinomycetota bacterium]
MTSQDPNPASAPATEQNTGNGAEPARQDPDRRTPCPWLAPAEQPLSEAFDLALLDLDGVVYLGPQAVDGAVPALGAAKDAGMRLAYVTNNAARPPQVVADHLRELGIPAEPSEVVTSAQVAASLLARRLPAGAGVLVVGGQGLRQALREEGLEPVEALSDGPQAVVQGFSPDLGWLQLAEGADAVRSGLFWMATNLDMTVPRATGPAPGNGTLVAAVRTAAGREPDQVAGKPDPAPFVETVRRLGSERPLVVGDRLDTDLEGARAARIPGLLVLTGVSGVPDLLTCPEHRRPTFLGADLSALAVPHPATTVRTRPEDEAPAGPDSPSGGVEATCREAQVVVGTCAGGTVRAEVVRPGEDALDLLRAACSAVWAWNDSARTASRSRRRVDTSEISTVLERQTQGAPWSR